MLTLAQIGQLFDEKLPWTLAPERGNIAGSRAVPASPSVAPVIPCEGDLSL
jgi:hypothetical protein